MKKRQRVFDQNRKFLNMEDLEQKIAQLTEVVNQQALVIQQQQLAMQQQQQDAAIQQQQQTTTQQQQQQGTAIQQQQLASNYFQLSAKDVIQQFRQLRPLDETQFVGSFIRSVEKTFELCANNVELREYGLHIVRNEKIMGDAGRSIRELSENSDWEQIKSNLKQHFRPRQTYGEIFNYCRMVKVSNLRELFNVFEKAKFDLSELYEFDGRQSSLYSPVCINRDLVDILLEKIDGPIRAHINPNSTLSEVVRRYSELKLLDDSRCIDFKYKKEVNRFKVNSNNNFQINKQLSNNNRPKTKFSSNNQQDMQNSYLDQKYLYGQSNRYQNTYQPSDRNFQPPTRNNYSAQSRNTYNTNKQHFSDNTVEPMDITNIEQSVNFLEESTTNCYR